MKIIRTLLFVLHAVVGVGAVAGGLACITNPQSPLGVPVELLRNSPFHDYLIPGILLFAVIGLGNLFSAVMMRFHRVYQGYISSVFSSALVIWIVVQCIMIRSVAPLHIIFFSIGCVEAALSIALLWEHRLFPTNIALKLYDEVKNRRSKSL